MKVSSSNWRKKTVGEFFKELFLSFKRIFIKEEDGKRSWIGHILFWTILIGIGYSLFYFLYDRWFSLVLAQMQIDLLERLYTLGQKGLTDPQLKSAYDRLLIDLSNYQTLRLTPPLEIISTTINSISNWARDWPLDTIFRVLSGSAISILFIVPAIINWVVEKRKDSPDKERIASQSSTFLGAIVFAIIAIPISLFIPFIYEPLPWLNYIGFPVVLTLIIGLVGALTKKPTKTKP